MYPAGELAVLRQLLCCFVMSGSGFVISFNIINP